MLQQLKSNPAAGSPPRMRGKHLFDAISQKGNWITPADAGKTYICKLIGRAGKDHPRGCGENFFAPPLCGRVLGSPPRMRGKRQTADVTVDDMRITPADAGKTAMLLSSKTACRDHPRGCGENRRTRGGQQQRVGSPPRMRGKPTEILCREGGLWITPADAGKTS